MPTQLDFFNSSGNIIVSNKIKTLQQAISKGFVTGELVDVKDEIPTNHHFIPGAYYRQIKVKAGTIIIGKIHKQDSFNFLLKGKLLLLLEDEVQEVCAPEVFITKAGSQKAAYVMEDIVFSNIFVTNETNINKLEEFISYDDSLELLEG